MEEKYYNIDNLLKTDANIFLIVGEKSNGKSFQVKNKIELDKKDLLKKIGEENVNPRTL